MNGRSPQNTHRSDRDDLYESHFPSRPRGEAIPEEAPSIEAGEKPSFPPEVEKGAEAEPKPPVLERPLEPEVPTPKVQPEEVAEGKEPALTIEEARETGDPNKMVEALEAAQEGEGNAEEQ